MSTNTILTQEEIDALAQELRNLRAERERIEAEEEAIKDLIKEYLKQTARTELSGPDYKITWSFCTKESVDTKALARAEPVIFNKFVRRTSYRRFTVR